MAQEPDNQSALQAAPALLSVARAAHRIGDRELERAARQELEERYGIKVTFVRRRPGEADRA